MLTAFCYLASGIYCFTIIVEVNFVNLGTIIAGVTQLLLVVFGIRLAKKMGAFYEKPTPFIIGMSAVKIIAFIVVALNAFFEASLIESQFTQNEEKNLSLAESFETLTDINLFLGFADLTVGLFFWLI